MYGTSRFQSLVGRTDTIYLSLPQHGPREPVSIPGCGIGTGYFIDKLERPGLTGRDFRDPGACLRHYTTYEPANQLVIQGMFLLSLLWARILFDYGASHSFIATSCMRELGLEIETLENPLYVSSPLGTRVSVDMICQGCELEISGILLTMNLRVIDMSKLDVILRMDWLTTH